MCGTRYGNFGRLGTYTSIKLCRIRIPMGLIVIATASDAIKCNNRQYWQVKRDYQHVQGSVHGNRPVWNKTQDRGHFKYRCRQRKSKVTVSPRLQLSWWPKREMMPRSIILWRKLVRVIVALEADLSVIALGPSMCFFYLQISGLLGEATATV